jgi:hypothetical protein
MKYKFFIILAIIVLMSFPAQAQPERLQDFATVEALERWLERDNTDSHLFLVCNKDGLAQLTGTCEDKALNLIEQAEREGIRLHLQVLDNSLYYRFYKKHLPIHTYHAAVIAIVGNEIYLIEPSTDEIWLMAVKD